MEDPFANMTLDEAMENPFWDDISIVTRPLTGEHGPGKSFEVKMPSCFVMNVPDAVLTQNPAWGDNLCAMIDDRLQLDIMEARAVMRWKAKLLVGSA